MMRLCILSSKFFLVAGAVACARTGPVIPAHQPLAQEPQTDSLAVSIAVRGDSAGLATLVTQACAGAAERSKCLERLLAAPAAKGYVRVAMGALNAIGAKDPEIKRTGHVYAHAIGIAAGSARSSIAQTFTQCSESYQSGCYHGIIQAWFAGLDSVSAQDANELCAPFRNSEADRWIRYQCVHGMGHGLTMLYKHDLPKGLAACDLLKDWWDRHSCYSGAFMENIVNVTMPHHPASELANHDHSASGGNHDMAAMHHATPSFKPVDPSDQLYPCSKLPERYLTACYEMQTSVMLHNNKGDIAGAAKSCDTAPHSMRTVCYASLGRDISSYSQQNHQEAIRLCSLGTPKYQPWCYYGLVKNFIDLEARPEDGIALCRVVPSADAKAICYAAVGEQILVLKPVESERRGGCSTAETEYVEMCLYGARLTSPPAALQKVWATVRAP